MQTFPPANNRNPLFTAVTNLNAHLTALHAALPPRTALLPFLGHSDLCSVSALAARCAEYQASQNQCQVDESSSGEAIVIGNSLVRQSTADDWALEVTVICARMGLLFALAMSLSLIICKLTEDRHHHHGRTLNDVNGDHDN